ncbi:PepSY domain-containing protein [Methylomonas sp. LL1]|uniref:PepSY domain-containing protein n=1 Tax=Methylomonas sp. LL1 TaxID=2785785 RepID=UPI0018C400EB|nr:PepSY domain-containing protein [Methylomonas sp. LL1]QPK64819.1 PepSY domain-containing protein [Methylomonas sp. LL1]
MKVLNWLLYQTHRWLGVVLGLFMFIWLLTGLVIMYSAPTTQNRTQQLAYGETLAPHGGWLSLGEVWRASSEQRKLAAMARKPKQEPSETHGHPESADHRKASPLPDAIADARLVRLAGEPIWLIEDVKGLRFALSVIDGTIRETSPDQAVGIAEKWFQAHEGKDQSDIRYVETVEYPIILRNRDNLRPFHRIEANDHTELLISSRTGEILHASTRWQRAFYWAGNWLHTFKPLDSLGFGHIRHEVQTWAGLTAAIATLSGLIIGWLRWRPGFAGKPTYSQGRTQPYREFWFKWHFWAGLIGGSFALSWAASGFIETNPWKWFSPANYSREELSRYLGSELPAAMSDWRPSELPFTENSVDIVEIVWTRLGGEAVLQAYTRDGQRLPLSPVGVSSRLSETALSDAVKRLAGDHRVSGQTLINEYDSYYYPRHNQGVNEKPLPVIRAEFNDDAGTLVYLDPQDGRLLNKLDRSRRVFRWLYSALHHWDFGWLYYRPLWDLWMLVWVSLGLVLGASSVVIGWKRLKRTFMPKKRKVGNRSAINELATETGN